MLIMSRRFGLIDKFLEFISKHIFWVNKILKKVTITMVVGSLLWPVLFASSVWSFFLVPVLGLSSYLVFYNTIFSGYFSKRISEEQIKYFERQDAERAELISRRQNAGRIVKFVSRHAWVIDNILNCIFVALGICTFMVAYIYYLYDKSAVWVCAVFIYLEFTAANMIYNDFYRYFGDLVKVERGKKFQRELEKQKAKKIRNNG